MMPNKKIVPSGIERADKMEQDCLRYAFECGCLIHELVAEALKRLRDAEKAGLEKLNRYVPTERPLELVEAAVYLRMSKRALNEGTRPGRAPVVPFLKLNGRKLFRKDALDRELERREVRGKAVKL